MTDGNGMTYSMPMVPAYGGYGGGGENGMFGGGWMWFLLVWMAMFGWGGNGGFGGGNNIGNEVQRGFDQSAVITGINGIQNSMQNCCCENRLASSDLKYTIATESSATRTNDSENTQKILDKLCQLEMDGIRQNYEGQLRAIQGQLAAAQAENQSLRFAASQGAQTAQILANNEAQTVALEQYLAPVARPAYVVPNPNCCQQNYGYGNCGYAA